MDSKIKNSLRINGTTFNKLSVKSMTKEQFVKEQMKSGHVFNKFDAKTKEEKLGEAYDLLTKK